MQSNLSCREKANLTIAGIARRKAEAERGKQAALDHLYENSYRIQKCLKYNRKVGHKEW